MNLGNHGPTNVTCTKCHRCHGYFGTDCYLLLAVCPFKVHFLLRTSYGGSSIHWPVGLSPELALGESRGFDEG